MRLYLLLVVAILSVSCDNVEQSYPVESSRIKEYRLEDGTRCIVTIGSVDKPSGITCDWR